MEEDGRQREISTSSFHMSVRRPEISSPSGAMSYVLWSRWTCVSGTHSSRSVGVKVPTSLTRQGETRW
jgi:hypothetical protein